MERTSWALVGSVQKPTWAVFPNEDTKTQHASSHPLSFLKALALMKYYYRMRKDTSTPPPRRFVLYQAQKWVFESGSTRQFDIICHVEQLWNKLGVIRFTSYFNHPLVFWTMLNDHMMLTLKRASNRQLTCTSRRSKYSFKQKWNRNAIPQEDCYLNSSALRIGILYTLNLGQKYATVVLIYEPPGRMSWQMQRRFKDLVRPDELNLKCTLGLTNDRRQND